MPLPRHAIACVLLLIGCEADPTQIMVAVQTDLATPEELDEVRIDVRGFGVQPTSTADLRSEPLPRTLALVHRGGPLGPVVVEARGYRAGVLVVTRRARVSFVKNDARLLELWLRADCAGVDCDEEQTCTERGCANIDVAALPPWTGDLSDAGHAIDGGGDDAGPDADGGGPEDGGPEDGGPLDAARDVAPDAIDVDGGTDAGEDGGLDAGTTTVSFGGSAGTGSCGGDTTTVRTDVAVPAGATLIVSVAWRTGAAGPTNVVDAAGNTYLPVYESEATDQPRMAVYASRLTSPLAVGAMISATHPDVRATAVVVDRVDGAADAEAIGRRTNSGRMIMMDGTTTVPSLVHAVVANANHHELTTDWNEGSSIQTACMGGANGRMNLRTYWRLGGPGPYAFDGALSSSSDWSGGLTSLRE